MSYIYKTIRKFKEVLAIGRFDFGMVKVYNDSNFKEHYFPLHPSIKDEVELLPIFGHEYYCSMIYYVDVDNNIVDRVIKYAIPKIKLLKIK